MKIPLIGESDVMTFADYFRLNAALDDVMAHFGYGFEARQVSLASTKRELPHLDELRQRLYETMPHITLSSEMARREFLIAPLLAEVIRWTQSRLRPEFALKVSPQLQGNLDYLFQSRQRLLVVEAKRDDLENGFVQLAVEMIALDQWDSGGEPLLYGAVSSGTAWQFGFLDRKAKHLTQDLNVYGMPINLEAVARILVGILLTE